MHTKLLAKYSSHKGPASFAEILRVGDVNRLNIKQSPEYTDRKLQQFNCYKHKFTNYKDLITVVYQSDMGLATGARAIHHIYHQLSRCDIPDDYRESVALSYRLAQRRFRQFIAAEARLSSTDSVRALASLTPDSVLYS